MNKDKDIINQRRNFIKDRIAYLKSSGLSTALAVSVVSKDLFLSEKTIFNDMIAKTNEPSNL